MMKFGSTKTMKSMMFSNHLYGQTFRNNFSYSFNEFTSTIYLRIWYDWLQLDFSILKLKKENFSNERTSSIS